jgi:hypothetical protein
MELDDVRALQEIILALRHCEDLSDRLQTEKLRTDLARSVGALTRILFRSKIQYD